MTTEHRKIVSEDYVPYPGSLWGWFGALALMPLFAIIGQSVNNGWPPAHDFVAWTFLIALVSLGPVGQVLAIGLWHLRERLGRPVLWTANRQDNIKKVFWMSALAAFIMVPDQMIGWDGVALWLIRWFIISIPMFTFFECYDALISFVAGLGKSRT